MPTMVEAIGPAQDFEWRPQVNRRYWVPILNDWLLRYAQGQGLVLADYHAALSHQDGSLRKDPFRDSLHPNDKGYAAMMPVLLEAIERSRKARAKSDPPASSLAP